MNTVSKLCLHAAVLLLLIAGCEKSDTGQQQGNGTGAGTGTGASANGTAQPSAAQQQAGQQQQQPGMAQQQPGAQKAGQQQMTFVMIPKGVHPYYEPCWQGFQDAGKKYGVKTEYQAAKAFEVPLQVEVIENTIARNVTGMTISAQDDQGLVPVINEAVGKGIKVITFDAPAPSSKALCYIGTDNEAAGYAGGEALLKAMGSPEGEVAVLQGGLAAPNLNLRFQGFERCLKEKAPGVKIVAREDTQGKIDQTVNKTEAILQAHPNLRAIFGVSAECAPGASAVLRQRPPANPIILAGFDDLPDTLEGIRQGTVSFAIAQRTYKMGWLSVEKLIDAVNGKELPKVIDTGILIINKDNVDTYMEEMKQEFAAATK